MRQFFEMCIQRTRKTNSFFVKSFTRKVCIVSICTTVAVPAEDCKSQLKTRKRMRRAGGGWLRLWLGDSRSPCVLQTGRWRPGPRNMSSLIHCQSIHNASFSAPWPQDQLQFSKHQALTIHGERSIKGVFSDLKNLFGHLVQ